MLKRKDHDLDLSAEEDAYKGLVGGSSSDEANASLSENEDDEVGDQNQDLANKKQQRIEEMRRRLLGGLTEDKSSSKRAYKNNEFKEPKDFDDQSNDVDASDDS